MTFQKIERKKERAHYLYKNDKPKVSQRAVYLFRVETNSMMFEKKVQIKT